MKGNGNLVFSVYKVGKYTGRHRSGEEMQFSAAAPMRTNTVTLVIDAETLNRISFQINSIHVFNYFEYIINYPLFDGTYKLYLNNFNCMNDRRVISRKNVSLLILLL